MRHGVSLKTQSTEVDVGKRYILQEWTLGYTIPIFPHYLHTSIKL